MKYFKFLICLFLLCSCINETADIERDKLDLDIVSGYNLSFDYNGGESVRDFLEARPDGNGSTKLIVKVSEEAGRGSLPEKVVNGESHYYYDDWLTCIVSQDRTVIRVVVQANNTKEDRSCSLDLFAGERGTYFLIVNQSGNTNASAKYVVY